MHMSAFIYNIHYIYIYYR